jgi:phosphoglycerate kinase
MDRSVVVRPETIRQSRGNTSTRQEREGEAMTKKSISSVDVQGQRVLMRVDFNVPVKAAAITDDRRIRAALPAIRSVIDRGGRLVLISHLGRPAGTGFEPKFSLKPCAQSLAALIGRDVHFPSNDCTDAAAAKAVADLQDGEAVLLENLRFHKEEKAGDVNFAAKLAAYADVYVNEAFGTCHRPHASMVAVPKAMAGKPRVMGFLVEKEIAYLREALANPAKPFVVVLGGAKVSDKMGAIEHLLPKADHVLVGGAMAYTFLKALGKDVGSSRVEEDRLDEAHRTIELAAKLEASLHLPEDHICSTEFSETVGHITVNEGAIPDGSMGLDIGPKAQAHFAAIIRDAKAVVWNGPMGVFEWGPFRAGTEIVAHAMAEATASGATTIVGGGDSAAAAEIFGVADRVSHVSTGGGASLEMLEGKSFESVDLLDDA